MNGTTKQRYISTSIWNDEWFDSISGMEKLIYFHLLTNHHTNPAGVYPFALKYICADTGFSRDDINAAIKKFEHAGKAFFYKEYMIIPKWLKHQKITERTTLYLGVKKIIQALPDEIKEFISDKKHYDFDIENIIKTSKQVAYPEKQDSLPKNIGSPTQKTAHDFDSDYDIDIDSDINLNNTQTDNNKKTEKLKEPVDNSVDDLDCPVVSDCLSVGLKINPKESETLKTELQKHDLCPDFIAYALSRIKKEPEVQHPLGLLKHILFNIGDYPDYVSGYKNHKKDEVQKQKVSQKARAPTSCPMCGGNMKYAFDACKCNACNAFYQYDPIQNKYIPESELVF